MAICQYYQQGKCKFGGASLLTSLSLLSVLFNSLFYNFYSTTSQFEPYTIPSFTILD
jgi:hypothetical protein